MELLKERILKDGIVIMPNVLRVDSFLNHQIDCTLYRQIAKEFKERYKDTKINKILTIEASGIGIALATAFELGDVPVVFAKKGTAKTTSTHLYTAKVHSFTKGIDYDAIVSKKYLSEDDNPLNFMIRKVVLEGDKEYLIGLDSDEEVTNAFNYYYQKHKEEISRS